MFKLIVPAENVLRRWPRLWHALDQPRADLAPPRDGMRDHVVIVGCGRVGRHIAEALGRLQIPRLIVEADPARLDKLKELGVPVLYGDAGSSEILDHASLDHARELVITLPDDAAAAAVVVTARKLAPHVRIVARASTWEGARRLRAEGADDVVRPELEGGVEIVRRTLLDLDLPVADVQRYSELVRSEGLDESERPSAVRARVLDQLLRASRELEIVWVILDADSPLVGKTLGESEMRTRTGASIVAVDRDGVVTPNPIVSQVFQANDRVALIGTAAQIADAGALVGSASNEAYLRIS
jgi:CPA2 family monovalent cation:H+ antiporter-2